MFPNLLGQQALYRMTDDDMAKIINVSRETYRRKIRNGRFTPSECTAFCIYFNKRFAYLFSKNDDPLAN